MRRIVPFCFALFAALLAAAPTMAGSPLEVLGIRPGITVKAAREALAARGGRQRALGEKDGVHRWRWKGRGIFPGDPEVVVVLEASRDTDDAKIARIVATTDDPGPVAREWRRAFVERWGAPDTKLVDVRDRRGGALVEGTIWARDGRRAVLVVIKAETANGIRVRRIGLFLEPDPDPVALVRRRFQEIRAW